MRLRLIATGGLLLANLIVPQTSLAQVPPHQPGTVCLTPTFWCSVAPHVYPIGTPCFCASSHGNVPGTIG